MDGGTHRNCDGRLALITSGDAFGHVAQAHTIAARCDSNPAGRLRTCDQSQVCLFG